jgi:hypothetical protein
LIQRIFHLFDSKNVHLNPGIILGIHNNREARHDHIYVINSFLGGGKAIDAGVYDDLVSSGCTLKYIDSVFSLALMMIKASGTIVFHGSLSPFKKQFFLFLVFYFFYRKVFRRIILVAWGAGDFNPEIGIFSELYHRVLIRIKCIVTLSRVDYNSCINLYGKNVLQINYIIKKDIAPSGSRNSSSHYEKRILVSHSGWPHNQHANSFDSIKTKIAESTEIICPLAYGDNDYIKEVIRVGSKTFGEKFSYFDNLLDVDEYRVFLKTVDIYVTSAEIQTGLFALTSCLGNGAKVYCGSNLYRSLTEVGFKVFSLDDLRASSKKDFYFMFKGDIDRNRSVYMKEYGDFGALSSKWNVVYDSYFNGSDL